MAHPGPVIDRRSGQDRRAAVRRTPDRRRGRPRELTEPTRVDLSLDACDYDQVYQIATTEGISVPQAIRLLLRRAFKAVEIRPAANSLHTDR